MGARRLIQPRKEGKVGHVMIAVQKRGVSFHEPEWRERCNIKAPNRDEIIEMPGAARQIQRANPRTFLGTGICTGSLLWEKEKLMNRNAQVPQYQYPELGTGIRYVSTVYIQADSYAGAGRYHGPEQHI